MMGWQSGLVGRQLEHHLQNMQNMQMLSEKCRLWVESKKMGWLGRNWGVLAFTTRKSQNLGGIGKIGWRDGSVGRELERTST